MPPSPTPSLAPDSVSSFPEINDYAIIGDCRTAALVSKCGSIEWLCWPRFDSPSIFAALLDRERGGFWKISPIGNCSIEREYIRNTNVLKTKFRTSSGTAELVDLMPVRDALATSMVPDHEIVRQLTCTSGEIEIEVALVPRANYGENTVTICERGKLGFRIVNGRGVHWLRSNLPLHIEDSGAFGRTTVHRGETLLFSFSYSTSSPTVLPPL